MDVPPLDRDLLQRVSAGDLRAVAVLYDRHVSTLLPVALRILRDRNDAEDIVHDAFVVMTERAAQYVPERGSVIAWLVVLVRNLSIDRTRRRDRRRDLTRDIIANEPTEPAPDPESLLAGAALRERVRAALGYLSGAQRLTLEVAFFEGLSYPEIAEREGVPLGTVKSRAARAIAALREALAREGVHFP